MKKIILSLIFLLFFIANSYATMVVQKHAPAGCTAPTLFQWHMENVDVTLGPPAGCSNGDTTASVGVGTPTIDATNPYDGTNGLEINANEWYQFDGVNEDIVDLDNAKIQIYVDIQTWADTVTSWDLIGGTTPADNFIKILWKGASGDIEIRGQYQAQNANDTVQVDCNINEAIQGYFRITYAWKVGEAGNDHYIGCDTDLDGTDNYSQVDNDTLTAFASADKAAFTMRVGNIINTTLLQSIDYLKITNDSGL